MIARALLLCMFNYSRFSISAAFDRLHVGVRLLHSPKVGEGRGIVSTRLEQAF